MSDAPTPGWRGAEPRSSESPGSRAWQPGAQAGDVPAGSNRGLKRMIALLALVGIAVGIGVAIVLLRPLKPACLVLIGAGYETNLVLPHNVQGWNGLGILEKEVSEKEGLDITRMPWDLPTKMRRISDRVELKDQTWKELWDKLGVPSYKEKTVVVFISLHGMAEKDEAYFLPNSGKKPTPDGFSKGRIRFAEVLESFEKIKDKNIVLLLDVCQAQANWPTGMLHNDFVAQLQKKYENKIKDMGNLVVICSASPDQRSWASEEWQTSVFTHYVTQALKGAGQEGASRVTALKMFQYVADKVDRWAQTNRARNQTPILLGTEALADKIELVHISGNYVESEPPARNFDPESLRAEWTRWKDLRKDHLPYVYAPHIWRLYQDSLVRYEQLARAGDPTGKAADLKKQLDRLYADLSAARFLEKTSPALGNSFPLFHAVGYLPPADLHDAELRKVIANLRGATVDDERNKVLARFAQMPDRERQYLQARLSQVLLKDSTTGAFDRVKDLVCVEAIERELRAPRRAAEVHLLRMMHDADPALDDQSVKMALQVRVRAEEAALSAITDGWASEPYAEAIFSWIRNDMAKADELRREGEDLLFGDPALHAKAAQAKLRDALGQYELISEKAQRLQRALGIRDSAVADLPYLAEWLAFRPAQRGGIDEIRASAENLGAALAGLREELNAQKDKKVPGAASVDQVAKEWERLRDAYQAYCENLKTQGAAVLQQNWHALDSALAIPAMEPSDDGVSLRIALLSRVKAISAQLQRNAEGKAETQEAVKPRVDWQRRLLRASIRPGEEIEGDDKDNVDVKARRVMMFLPDRIFEKTETMADKGPDLASAASLCRVLPGPFAEYLKNDKAEFLNPVRRLREGRTYQMLHWLAQRTYEDHWYEPGQATETYYVPAGRAYLDGAQGLVDRDQMPKGAAQKEKELRTKFARTGLTIAQKPNPHWTTESKFPLPWLVKPDKDLPHGTPMVWIEVQKPKAEKPRQHEPRKPIDPWAGDKKGPADTFTLSRDAIPNAVGAKVFFHVVYRGQHLMDELTFLDTEPHLIVRNVPAPNKAAFAVRMDSGFNYGAVSIVIDNSGSMKYAYPEDPDNKDKPAKKGQKRRFDYAKDALAQVLRKIPNNTSLSIFTLGRKEDSKLIYEPSVYRAPSPWRQEKQLDNLIADLDDVLGDFSSPIAAGILKSMAEGFPGNFNGPKVILVLTDGDDNSSFGVQRGGLGDNHAARIRAELKKANANYPDVQIVMVCFIQKDNPEHDRAQAQFEGLPNLEFRLVPEGAKLGVTIEELVRPRVQLLIEDKAAPGFQAGQPVNYHGDLALKWNAVEPNNYRAKILKTYPNDIAAELLPGRNIFAVLKREEKKLFLERAVLARQPEITRLEEPKEAAGWMVSLLENHRNFSNRLSQVVAFEKAEVERDILRQSQPGLTWLELEALQGSRPNQTLTWGKEWGLPAASYRLEMPSWAASRSKLTTWFWPESRERLLLNNKLVTRATVPVESLSATNPEGKIEPDPVIESALWEDHMMDDGAGGKVKEKCLVIRARHAAGKPVWIGLDRDRPEVGSELRYFSFPTGGKCTAFFYRLPNVSEVNLVLIDIEGFKAQAQRVPFTPELQYRVPEMFLKRFE